MSDASAYTQISNLTQDAIIEKYAPLVKRIAHHILGRMPQTVQLDDLIQAGMMGLLSAAKNYDVNKGASFETYAGIRIRGMMLDEVRKNDWVPRSVYRNSRMISSAIKQVENKKGRDAKDYEIAEVLGISLAEYHEILQDVNTTQIYGFDDVGVDDDMLDESYVAVSSGPFDSLQKETFRNTLSSYVDKLPEREKLVLALYYQEDLNLKEIGDILEVSESRVCQIHSQAMLRLQSKISEWQDHEK